MDRSGCGADGPERKGIFMSKHRTRTTRWDRLLSGVVCLALALGLLPPAGLIQTAQAHWADPYGQQLVEWGVMNPSPDLRLGDEITRAEFVAMCNRAFGYSRLGDMPFTDVPYTAWYAEDINIAYNAGYFNGVSADKASPQAPLTREQAAVLLARCLRFQEAVGEVQDFTDSHDLKEWSSGLIAAAAAKGIISGYTDGTYRPSSNITRGEVAAMLVRAIGNPIRAAGSHELGDVYGNVIIGTSNVTLRDTVILGDLYITGGVDLGNVMLENVTVLGRIVISGGGVSDAARSSVMLCNVEAEELVVDSLVNQFVTISAYGVTDIDRTYVRSTAYLEDACGEAYGLHYIELAGESGTKLQLSGSIKEVRDKTPLSLLQLVKGTAKKITIDEEATGSELLVDINTVVEELNLDVASWVHGDGDIMQLNIAAEGCEVDILPEHVSIRPGVTAEVDGKVVGSAAADELSSEPRLLSGYPSVTRLLPREASGLYAGNKPGTIYWAVSALADGSVSREDLLDPPVYGGNILKYQDKDQEKAQADNFPSEARVAYAWPINGLEPGNSYYISAILEDNRGNKSPLKVMSFTTPDDSVPEFVQVPKMSKTTCEIAQVTTMVNKSCTLHWVLLAHGAPAPTVQNFKTASFGGNYGSGSISVAKNVPIYLQVNPSRLQERTSYDLYLWLNDFDGVKSSAVVKVLDEESQRPADPTFTTPDETPPVVLELSQNDYTREDSIGFTFKVSESPVTLYWAVVHATDTKFIKESDLTGKGGPIKVETGMDAGAIVSGHYELDIVDENISEREFVVNTTDFLRDAAAVGKSLAAKDNNGAHIFRMYYMAKDAADNYSDVKSIIIHTADHEEPTVTISFPADKMLGQKPQADTDIMLIFSEQVKGEADLDYPTFVDQYNDVVRYANYPAQLRQAKEELGKELAKHITLYYKKDSLTNIALATPGDLEDQTEPKDENAVDPGWIDLREAVVEPLSDGRVMITLRNKDAVQLGGGLDYYFYFEDIYDDSYTGNPLKLTRSDGTVDGGVSASGIKDTDCYTDTFTTVYAQVWLSRNEDGISEIEGDPEVTSDNIPLDMVVDVIPKSTGNTNATDCWDMVIWCDLAVEFDVYRRVDSGEWELAAKGMSIGGLGQNNNTTLTAASLSEHKTTYTEASGGYIGGTDFADGEGGGKEYTRLKYDTVAGGLQMNHTYQYGISFTSVRDSSEREAWTSLVQLRFALVAGKPGNVQDLSTYSSVNTKYKDLVDARAVLDVISAVNKGNTTDTILETERQFSDERVPELTDTSPKFTVDAGTIKIDLALNREGTVYYVVAPADGTVTTTFDGKEIQYEKDGRILEGRNYPNLAAKAAAINASPGDITNYIPVDGTERANASFGDIIDFSKVTAPKVNQVYGGAFKGNLVRTGSFSYEGTREPVLIAEGMEPNRWYYVYLVLQSTSGRLGTEVQIYRVKTLDVDPPTITVGHGTFGATGVTMEIKDRNDEKVPYSNPVLNYALLRKDNLPELLTKKLMIKDNDGKYTKDSGKTVLEAMIERSGKVSYFDANASDDLKDEVMRYITQATGADKWNVWIQYYDQVGPAQLAEKNPWPQDCTEDMTEKGDYIMLVCARNSYKDSDEGKNYGFAAVQGLYKPNEVKPKLISPAVGADGTGIGTASISQMYDPLYNNNQGKLYKVARVPQAGPEPMGWWYYGELRFSFNDAIYVYDDHQNLKQVVGKKQGDASAGQISILELIDCSAIVDASSSGTNNNTFTLTFKGMVDGQGFDLTGLYNSSGRDEGKSSETLSVMFVTTKWEHEVNNTAPPEGGPAFYTVKPCFSISWK